MSMHVLGDVSIIIKDLSSRESWKYEQTAAGLMDPVAIVSGIILFQQDLSAFLAWKPRRIACKQASGREVNAKPKQRID